MPKRLGVTTSLFASPLFAGLQKSPAPHGLVAVTADAPASLAIKLREKTLDAAFLSPVDYARDYQMYGVVPDCCVAAGHSAASAVIVFREHLRTVTTLAVSPSSASEIVLANILFREQFGGAPTMIPFYGSLDDGLKKADGVLCVGDDARNALREQRPALNLIEEWYDNTDVPFVHGVWVSRPNALTPEETTLLSTSRDEGVGAIPLEESTRAYLSSFLYTLDDQVTAGLTEFFRMAFYHGILSDMPDLRIFPSATSSPSDSMRN
jgi:predicted solute-binding protein